MKNEFGLERLKNILPTGGEGTLSGYYQKDAEFIFEDNDGRDSSRAVRTYICPCDMSERVFVSIVRILFVIIFVLKFCSMFLFRCNI